jgi:Inner membrane component of T3SS, cytoplasmic domain/IPT/TIG domain
MSDPPMRLAALTVMGGPLHGRTFPLRTSGGEFLIGSGPDCQVCLELPGIDPVQARLRVGRSGSTVHSTGSGRGVFVNFDAVLDEMALKPGDMLRLGPATDADTVLIRLRFDPWEPAAALPSTTAAAPTADEDAALLQELASLEQGESKASPPERIVVADEDVEVVEAEPMVEDDAVFVVAEESTGAAEPTADDFRIEAPPTDAAPLPADDGGEEAFFVDETARSLPSLHAPVTDVAAASQSASGDDPFFVDPSVPVPPPPHGMVGPDDGFFIGEGESGPAAPAAAPLAEAAPTIDVSFSTDAIAFDEPPLIAPLAPAFPAAVPTVELPPESPVAVTRAADGVSAAAAPAPTATAARAPVKPAGASSEPASPAPRATGPTPRPVVPSSEGAPAARPRRSEDPGARRAETGARRVERPAAAARKAAGPPVVRYAAIGAGVLLVLVGGAYVVLFSGGRARIEGIEPARARVGQTIILAGKDFDPEARANVVLFGDKPGTVVGGGDTSLEVRVPELPVTAGQDSRVPVRVRVAGRDSKVFDLTLYGGPTLHGISPDVALPGEEVVLAGEGWDQSATVRFGGTPADVVQATASSLRVRVPALQGGPGTAAPVVVSAAGVDSNQAPFLVGRIPLVTKVEPGTAAPGDVVTLSGRGFKRQALDNTVRIGGVRALLASAFDSELKIVVPRVSAGGPQPLEVRVAGLDNVAQASLTLGAPLEAVDFHFVAEPFDVVPGKGHAVLATGLGPAFVLAASGGKSAADRAIEAARRLNASAAFLKASREWAIEARNLETAPALALVGKPDALLEPTDDDAAAYNEDWTGLRGRGGPVTRARLGVWWGALAKDLVLLLVRGEKPQFAAALAPEGRVLGDVFQAAQKTGRFGVATSVVTEMRQPTRDALRLLAFRVPAGVGGPGGPTDGASAATSSAPPLKLDGNWSGSEIEGGLRRYISVQFRGTSGTLGYEGAVTVSIPLMTVELQPKSVALFSLQYRGGIRYYTGKWDGQVLSGTISSDPQGKEPLGTFELKQR